VYNHGDQDRSSTFRCSEIYPTLHSSWVSTVSILISLKRLGLSKLISVSAAMILMFVAVFIPYFYIQDYAINRGMDRQLALYLLTAMNTPSIFGRVILGWVADKLVKPAAFIHMSSISRGQGFNVISKSQDRRLGYTHPLLSHFGRSRSCMAHPYA
jgi:hypothetical protein